MPETFSIPSRFNGPLASGNGGYCAGLFAGLVEGVSEVRLRSPVSLDAPLEAVCNGNGAARVLDGSALVAEVRLADGLTMEAPAPGYVRSKAATLIRCSGARSSAG